MRKTSTNSPSPIMMNPPDTEEIHSHAMLSSLRRQGMILSQNNLGILLLSYDSSDTSYWKAEINNAAMTELPKANLDPSNGGPGDDGTTTCSNDEDVKNTSACKRNHEEESVVTAKCAAGDATATDGKKGKSSVSIQNTGGSNKRGKREWLAFRGSRQSRVGDDYQVASLPPVGSNTKPNKSEKD